MFNRIAPRRFSAFMRHLRPMVVITVAIMVASQIEFEEPSAQVADDAAAPRHDIAPVAPRPVETTGVATVEAPVEIPAWTEADQAPPTTPAGVSQPPAKPATPSREFRAVSPRARAEALSGFRDRPAGPSSAEKSYTGAGRAFDAVH